MSEELKPCPFCGEKHNLWRYISAWSALIECGACGIKLPNSEVRTAYHIQNDPIPEQLRGLESRCVCAKDKDDNEIEMYWIKPTDSFMVFGHTKRWNTRTPDHTALVRQLVEALEESEAIAKDHIKLLEEAKWTRAQAEEIILARTMLENMREALTAAKEAGF